MMKRSVLLLAGAVVGLSACDSFKDAMTAHVDTVAKAGSQELSVDRLGTLIGESPLPLQKDVAKAVAQVWVNYHLLGQAAVAGDSLADPALIREAMWSQYANIRAGKFMETVSASWTAPTGPVTEAEYNQGGVLAASHILLGFPGAPQQAPTDAVRDSVRRVAEALRSEVTPENFSDMARRHSTEPNAAQSAGNLGVFPPQQMIPEFSRAVTALQPGAISQPVLTQFGYHIIRRTPYADVNQEQLGELMTRMRGFRAESTYRANLERSSRVAVRSNIAKTMKAVAEDPDAHRNDRTVLATHNKGEFTAGRLAQWVLASPPQQQLRQQLAAAPDSMMPRLVEQFVYFDLVLAQADSAKVEVDSAQADEMQKAFVQAVTNAWSGLSIAPRQVADSAKTPAERAAVTAERVDRYFTALVKGEAAFVQIPAPVEAALREKFTYKINDAGVDRALEVATRARAKADSTRAAQQPPTAVPMPPGAGATPPAGGAPATPPPTGTPAPTGGTPPPPPPGR